MQRASVVLVSDIGILLFNLLFKCSFYLTYYFGNFSYPIIYPIVTFTYMKVKNYPVKNSSVAHTSVSHCYVSNPQKLSCNLKAEADEVTPSPFHIV